MPSLRTDTCPHEWLRDEPGAACIFCGLPKPVRPGATTVNPATGVLSKVPGESLRVLAESEILKRLSSYFTNRDPGDEDGEP